MRRIDLDSKWAIVEDGKVHSGLLALRPTTRLYQYRNIRGTHSMHSKAVPLRVAYNLKGGTSGPNLIKVKGVALAISKTLSDAKKSQFASVLSTQAKEAKPIQSPQQQLRKKLQKLLAEKRGKVSLQVEEVMEQTLNRNLGHDLWKAQAPGWGVAPALDMKYEAPRIETYKGTVKNVKGDSALVLVSSPGDWDKWEARIPLAAFNKFPEEGEEFSCAVSITGPDISVRAKLIPKRARSLKDLGIDKEELLKWASQIDL